MVSEVEIRAPAEQTEGTRSQILRWLKSVGESVTENEPLIELETDKVTVEVPSPGSGTLRQILKQEQDEIGPGDLLGLIEAAGAVASADAAGATTASTAARAKGNGDRIPAATMADEARVSGGAGPSANARGSANTGADEARASGGAGPSANARGSANTGADEARASGGAGPSANARGSANTGADEARASGGAGPSANARGSTNAGASNVASAASAHGGRYAELHSHDASGAATLTAGPSTQNLSPAVRRLLAERGLDASAVRGTGNGGRITVADVLAHDGASQALANATADARGSGAAGGANTNANGSASGIASRAPANNGPRAASLGQTRAASVPGPASAETLGASHRVPHTATRKRIAEHMVQSLLHTAPHVTTVFEADMTAVLEHRQRNKDDFARRGAPLTLTAYFLQATVAAIRAVPGANSRWTDSALEVFDSMHLGVATALETGLVVPVLRDVQSLGLFETAKGLDDLVSRARDGHLTPADVRGGTFTVSNHGVSGSLVATPIIINQPQSAILGIGKLEKRPVVVTSADGEDRIVIRPRCYVTLTIDHRVMDGHQANRFLQTFVERLSKPE